MLLLAFRLNPLTFDDISTELQSAECGIILNLIFISYNIISYVDILQSTGYRVSQKRVNFCLNGFHQKCKKLVCFGKFGINA